MSVTDPDSDQTTMAYDAVGNKTVTVDGVGDRTSYAYDALNRQTTMTDGDGNVTSYAFDAVGNQTGLTDPDGNRTTFAFDAVNRQTQETDPLGKTLSAAFDAAGRQTFSTDRLGRTKSDSYDGDNRLTEETWSSGNVQDFTYDGNGNQLTATDSNGTYSMAYDGANRVVQVTEPFGGILTYAYDLVGNRIETLDSLGGLTCYTYDALHELTSVVSSAGLREDFTYTARGQVETIARNNNQLVGSLAYTMGTTVYSYDDAGRTTNILTKDGSNHIIANYTTAYDAAGRVTAETDNGATTSYSYDQAGQLTDNGAYSYDAAGNRNMAGYGVGAGNRMLNDGTYTYTYDDEGDRTKKSKGANAETWYYSYDQRDQLTAITERAADSPMATLLYSATFTYDVYNRRIETDAWQGGTLTVTRYAYDQDNIWADLTSGNALAMRYVRPDGTDALGARISAGGVAGWYLYDRQQTVKGLMDNNGVVQDTLTYDAVGALVSETYAAFGDRYGYTAREVDKVSGLVYDRYRYYDTKTSRWITEDRDRFTAGDSSLTRYVENNPTNASDPSGLAKVEIRYLQLSPLGYFHAYIIVTDLDGTTETETRFGPTGGGPSGSCCTDSSLASSSITGGSSSQSSRNSTGSSPNSNSSNSTSPGSGAGAPGANVGPWGALKGIQEKFDANAKDWHQNAALDPSVTVVNDNQPASFYNDQIKAKMNVINNYNIPYNPLTTNSNAGAEQVIQDIGFPRPTPPVWAPGWDYNLHANQTAPINQAQAALWRTYLNTMAVARLTVAPFQQFALGVAPFIPNPAMLRSGLLPFGMPNPAMLRLGLPAFGVPPLGMRSLGILGQGMPGLGIPSLNMPSVSMPSLGMPSLGMPNLSVPNVSMPSLNVPNVSMPNLSMPTLSMPSLKMPSLSAPKLGMPGLSIPGLGL